MTDPLANPPLVEESIAAVPGGLLDQFSSVARPVLRGVARGLMGESGGFAAGELWLLDDASQNLVLAARWARKGGALSARPSQARRRLANAPAEVAALAGGAVVLEQAGDAAGWELAAPAPSSAICVPVASATKLHGVLWLLSDKAREVPDSAVELAEVVAGRLALEVERLSEESPVASRPRFPKPSLQHSQESSEPADATFEPIDQAACPPPTSARVAPVEAAAWAAAHCEGLSQSGCWELADGRLLAVSAAAIDSPESTTASQRAAVEWLMSELPLAAMRSADAGDLLTRLNIGLQESDLAGEGLAIAAALVDSAEDAAAGLGGTGTYATAGPTIALSIRAAATETHVGDLIPLGWLEPDAAYAPRAFELAVRGRLVLTAGDPRLTSPLVERRLGDVYRAATSDAHREMTAERCLRRLASGESDDVLAAVALRRE